MTRILATYSTGGYEGYASGDFIYKTYRQVLFYARVMLMKKPHKLDNKFPCNENLIL